MLPPPSDGSAKLQCKQRPSLPEVAAGRAVSDGKTLLIAYFDSAPELWQFTFRLLGFDW